MKLPTFCKNTPRVLFVTCRWHYREPLLWWQRVTLRVCRLREELEVRAIVAVGGHDDVERRIRRRFEEGVDRRSQPLTFVVAGEDDADVILQGDVSG